MPPILPLFFHIPRAPPSIELLQDVSPAPLRPPLAKASNALLVFFFLLTFRVRFAMLSPYSPVHLPSLPRSL